MSRPTTTVNAGRHFERASIGGDRPATGATDLQAFVNSTKNAFRDKRGTTAVNSKDINSMVVDDVDIICDLTVQNNKGSEPQLIESSGVGPTAGASRFKDRPITALINPS